MLFTFHFIKSYELFSVTDKVTVTLQFNIVCEQALGFLYIRAKAIIFFDLLPLTHCSINSQIGNNATVRKRRRFRFRSHINVPLILPH